MSAKAAVFQLEDSVIEYPAPNPVLPENLFSRRRVPAVAAPKVHRRRSSDPGIICFQERTASEFGVKETGNKTEKTMAQLDSLPLFDGDQTSMIYECKTMYRDAFKVLYDFFQNQTLCDIEIVVGSKTVKCHRVVLACISQYFKSMFTSQMAESHQSSITIKDIDETAFEHLIKFAYTAKIKFTTENVQSLLYASSILQMETVACACGEFMKTHLHPTNCIGIRAFAEQHGRQDLIEKADTYTRDQFLPVVDNEEFLNMTPAHLLALVSSSDLNVHSEMEVYEAVIRWVKHSIEGRQKYLAKLIGKVRLGLLPPAYLMEEVCAEELLKKDLECRDCLDEAKNYQLSLAQVVPGLQLTEQILPRKSCAGVIFCVGGRGASGDPFKSIEVYDLRKNQWFQIAEMSNRRRHVGVVSVAGKLYAVGGHDGTDHLNTGELFDPATNKWTVMAPMATLRRGIGLASLGGPIYAVGGLDDATCFNIVERYDAESDTWNYVQAMNFPRGGVAVATLKGHMYAMGGNDGATSLESCERYDPHLNKWSMIAPMNKRRAGAGVAELNGKLYMIGGFDDNAPLESVESYDPEANAWTLVAKMTCARGGVGVAALAGKIYAVGGHDGSSYLSSVEAYDPCEDSWTRVAGISSNRAGAGIATVSCHLETLRDLSKLSMSAAGFKRLSTGARVCCTVQCSIIAHTSIVQPE